MHQLNLDKLLRQEIGDEALHKLQCCQQCGSCSGSCPLGDHMDNAPNRLFALLSAGEYEKVVRSNSPWYCLTCCACQVRCPMEINPAHVMAGLRRASVKARMVHPDGRKLANFYKSFALSVRLTGKSYEPGILALYCLRSDVKKLFVSIPMAVQLFLRGLLPVFPEFVRGWNPSLKTLIVARLSSMVGTCFGRRNGNE